MEKRKWLWKRKSSERSPGESESSESLSSHSERYSDEQEQEAMRESPNDSLQSLEVTSKAVITDDEMKESVKCLTEKLSAALVNVSAKEDLVKQHAKVAEEAVAGWERAENEVVALKQQLEVAVQQNLNLEVRSSHLDSALKECVRQMRQARDEQEKRICDAVMEKSSEWESTKAELEKQILDLQAEAEAARAEKSASVDPNTLLLVKALQKENSALKQELVSCCKELEIMTIERDLSTQAAETASKLQLESIRKVAKLEAECRRLQSIARKSSPLNNQKSIPEVDQFKNEKHSPKSLAVEIDMMDDFLEMERLAALPESKSTTPLSAPHSASEESGLRAKLDSMTERVTELENKLGTIEAEKLELKCALDESVESLREAQSKMAEAETRLEELQQELIAVNKTKELLEFQLAGMEVEARTMSANADTITAEVEEERKVSAELRVKCQELENELTRTIQETELQQNTNSNGELKIKQEDLAVAADKLAECQKTIASLGRQLQSLATLEDFLIDTSNIPGFSRQEIWSLPSNSMLIPKRDSDCSRMSMENYSNLGNGNEDLSPSSSLSASSTNHVTAVKSQNSFGKFFFRSKSIVELENSQD